MNLRGKAIAVIETSRLLALDTAPICADTPQGKVVLLERDLHDLGLLVSEVEGIHSQKDLLQLNSIVTLDATLLTQKIIGLLQDARSKC
jgi:chemotaxis signal transduction protein